MESSSMRVAVTGGAGYIGSTLIKNLLERGDEVVSVDNLSLGDYGYLESLETTGLAEYLVGDIRDGPFLEKVFKGSDAIAHLAALPGLVLCNERPDEAVSVNVYGTHQVLETARKLDIGRVVFCSSASVYGAPLEMPVKEGHRLRPLNLYGVTKLAGEKLMEGYHDNYGMETVNLRFGNIFGVGLYTKWDTVIPKFVRQALEGEPLTIYGDGGSSRDFVHVEDIARAMTLALETPGVGGEALNVGGETMSIGRLAQVVIEEVERARNVKAVATHAPPRPGETREFSYDTSKIRRMLGFEPEWDVRRGVRQLIEYGKGLSEGRV